MKLDVSPDVTPIVQAPRKVPQVMIQCLKEELVQVEQLGVIHKLDINEATDWCHNLVLICKPSGKQGYVLIQEQSIKHLGSMCKIHVHSKT